MTASAMPLKLSEVVKPMSLASFVPLEAWSPLREVAGRLADAREAQRKVKEKLEEVEAAIWSAQTRAPLNASALADCVLAGEVPAVEPEPEREGLAKLPPEQLRSVREALKLRAVEVGGDVAFYRERVRVVGREILREAATKACAEYVRLMEPVAALHRELSAAQGILADSRNPIVGQSWGSETFHAPAAIDRTKVRTIVCSVGEFLHAFDSGSGVGAASAAWRDAVKAATGVEPEP